MINEPQIALLATQRKKTLVSILDQLCQQLELTDTQYQTARDRYETVGAWLGGANSYDLRQSIIYPQGSVALGTAIKPLGQNEFDVDLVCHLPTLANHLSAHSVKAMIGDRLKEHGKYEGMLEEKMRCWRINYANEFHLDITPSITNPKCAQRGELVPCKRQSDWKPTNPKGYIQCFEQYAALTPRYYLFDSSIITFAQDSVAPLPVQTTTKPVLKRITQLIKRNRDHVFSSPNRKNCAPISIILTTLAAWSYASCVSRNIYNDEFELIQDVIRRMPDFIKIEDRFNKPFYIIKNESTTDENFADKWNIDSRLPAAFFEWHKNIQISIDSLLNIEGTDKIAQHLSTSFGASQEQIKRTFEPIIGSVSASRSSGSLVVAPVVGIIASNVASAATVRTNTFFGR